MRILRFGLFLVVLIALVLMTSCDKSGQGPAASSSASKGSATVDNKGPSHIDHGGISSISTDAALIEQGKKFFAAKGCTACHGIDNKIVGPALRGITTKREPEWLARMIMHPEQMLKDDPTAKQLLKEHNNVPMTNANVSVEETRAILAYLKSEN